MALGWLGVPPLNAHPAVIYVGDWVDGGDLRSALSYGEPPMATVGHPVAL